MDKQNTNKSLSLGEIAKLTNAELHGDPELMIHGVSDLDSATETDLSFLVNDPYGPDLTQALKRSQAGAVLIDSKTKIEEGRNFLVTEDPSFAFQTVAKAVLGIPDPCSGFTDIHPTAVVHESAKLGEAVNLGPYTVVDKDAVIGDNTTIGSHCYVGPHVRIGADCMFYPSVVIRENCSIGNRVILQAGAIIGSCGFGYTSTKEGRHVKLDQIGNVVIEDDVEVGSNTTIDRARFKTTRIKRGTKIDNLVQIGHNVVVGEDNFICGQTGIAGSSETGNHVILAGQVAVTGHVKIGSGVIAAGRTAVTKSITKPGVYSGIPAIPLKEHAVQLVHLRRISQQTAMVKELKKRVEELEGQLAQK